MFLFNKLRNRYKDPRLPNGRVEGKVTAYRLRLEGQTGHRYVDVTMAVAIGAGNIQNIPVAAREEGNLYIHGDYDEGTGVANNVIEESRTPSDILYRLDYRHYPTLGIIHPASITAREIVQNLQVNHTAAQQIQHLKNNQYPKHYRLQAILQEVPTTITIRLLDLSARDALHHTVNVDVPFAWSAPRQIELDAGD